MSYNLLAEGVQNAEHYATLSVLVGQFSEFEFFPIPDDALGIALPASASAPVAAEQVLGLVTKLVHSGLRVYDLYKGAEVSTVGELAELAARLEE